MDSEDLATCLALLALPGGGSMLRVLRTVRSPRLILHLDVVQLEALGLGRELAVAIRGLHGSPNYEAYRRSERLQSHGVHALSIHESAFPRQLRTVPCPPPLLFVRGRCEVLEAPHVAVVGSRKPTACGREVAGEIAASLVGYGLGIVSGLALGIDTAAHIGALRGNGCTLAVLGSALDRLYPQRNAPLAERIVAEGGAVLSEFPPGTAPAPAHFPQRNRIVSGLSLGVVVVEAGLPSGSLLTAQHAAEQGREVMAVPGSVRSPVSRGCHELLRNGAALVEDADDVVRALGDRFVPPRLPVVQPVHTAPAALADLGPHELAVLSALGFEETDADTLIARSGLEAPAVGAALVVLELRGLAALGLRGYMRV